MFDCINVHPMSNEPDTFTQTSLRLPTSTLNRVDTLTEAMRTHPIYGGLGAIKRSDVLRLVLVKGLEVLEGELLEQVEETNKKK